MVLGIMFSVLMVETDRCASPRTTRIDGMRDNRIARRGRSVEFGIRIYANTSQ